MDINLSSLNLTLSDMERLRNALSNSPDVKLYKRLSHYIDGLKDDRNEYIKEIAPDADTAETNKEMYLSPSIYRKVTTLSRGDTVITNDRNIGIVDFLTPISKQVLVRFPNGQTVLYPVSDVNKITDLEVRLYDHL